jgi:drug/metabolite transporter (DMT)-like permease
VQVDNSSGRAPGPATIAASTGLIVIVWAFNFIAAKVGLLTLPGLAMASFRVVLAGIVMVPTYLLCVRLPVFAEAAAAYRRGFTIRDLWAFVYLGFPAVCVNQICFTLGLQFTSVGHAAVIVGLGPLYVLVLAVLFRLETATWRKIAGMLIAIAGVAILAKESARNAHGATLLGDAITMTGSIGFAIYVVLGKRVAGKYDALTMTAFNHFAGALLVLPVALYMALRMDSARNLRGQPWQAWAAVLYMAIFSSALAYVFYFWLLRYLEASQLSAFTYLLPVLATILGIVLLGEKGSWSQVVGGVIALGGVYWIESGRSPIAEGSAAP